VVTVPFSSEDQKEYDVPEPAALSFYQSFKKKHAKNLGRHYLLLSQKLLPLRVACTGGHVPIEGESDEDQDEEKIGDDEDDEDADDENDADAEEENDDMDEGDDQEKSDSKKKKKKQKKTQAFSQYAFTSKLHQLIEELKNARDEDPSSKSLIFSQFNSTLKWLQQELPQHGFQFRTLSGDMSMAKRSAALRDFQHDPPTTVFILSMR
jgi:SNF2 family DNA or RNA helicase